MKMRNQILALTLAGLVSAGAGAAPYNGSFNSGVGYDGLVAPVSGFDIFSNGSAAFFCASAGGCGTGINNGDQINPLQATGLTVGSTIRTIYQGVANVVNPGTPTNNLVFPGAIPVGPGQWQISVAAVFNELVLASGPFNASLQPLATGSTVAMFYDNDNLGAAVTGGPLPNTLITTTPGVMAGVGYTDGFMEARGTIDQTTSPPTLVTIVNNQLSGVSTVNGLLNFASLGALPNTVGFIPRPGDFTTTTTLQFGSNTAPGFATVNFFDAANGFAPIAVNPAFVVRADANVDLSAAVPEPTSLALMGLGLAAFGAIRRRRTV